jgi:hypothetical protein
LTFYPALLLVAYMMIKAVLFIAVKKGKEFNKVDMRYKRMFAG